MLNRIILIGRIANDLDLRYTGNGKAVLRVTLAVDRKYRDGNGDRKTDFIICVAWGKLAETCAKYQHKGNLVCIEGSLEVRKYLHEGETKERFISEVVADDIRFLEKLR